MKSLQYQATVVLALLWGGCIRPSVSDQGQGNEGNGGGQTTPATDSSGGAGGQGSGTCKPSPEVCDGIDNNCNGLIDEQLGGLACSTGALGACEDGRTSCIAGVERCAPLSTTVTDHGVTISNFKINGGGNAAVVAPGASLTISFDYTIVDCGCPNCIDQIQIGFLFGNPLYCAYNGVPTCTPQHGTSTQMITAPTIRGSYLFHFDRSQDYSCPMGYWGSTDASQIVGVLCVGP